MTREPPSGGARNCRFFTVSERKKIFTKKFTLKVFCKFVDANLNLRSSVNTYAAALSEIGTLSSWTTALKTIDSGFLSVVISICAQFILFLMC